MPKLTTLHQRPPTLRLTTGVDMRHLATLLRYFQDEGSHPRSISELARLSIESLADILVTSNLVAFIPTQEHAAAALEDIGFNPNKIIPKNHLKALASERELNLETITKSSSPIPTPNGPMSQDDPAFKLAQEKVSNLLRREGTESYGPEGNDLLKGLSDISKEG